MVFPSHPSNYLDPTTHQWQHQTPTHQSGTSFQLVSPPRAPPQVRPGSMVDRARMANLPVPETALKCPRCESTNTKFCYFNNYSLSQPRHFCKTCRRYWTRGGALRSVPVGGGYRRNNKRTKSTSKSPVNSQCQPTTITGTFLYKLMISSIIDFNRRIFLFFNNMWRRRFENLIFWSRLL